ncbi:MAG: DNA alkylation repair protein [Coriobacteriia bacterium]|nr:DNA alkylation repair protein [Coriobacteriia bacterium]
MPAETPAAPAPDPTALATELLCELRGAADPNNVAGMTRFAISAEGTLGVSMPIVRGLARDAKRRLGSRNAAGRHELATLLWASELHEARIMASLVDVPALVDEAQAEAWVADLDSWDVCDQLCINLLRLTPLAWTEATEWTVRPEEFVKRAGFALGATLAVHAKTAPDSAFVPLLAADEREAADERNMVKKALNWQLRSIGKRNPALNAAASATAERILECHPDSPSARWIARDALRELQSDAVRKRLRLA